MVPNVTIVVDSSGVVPSTGSLVHSPRYQRNNCMVFVQHTITLTEEALYQWSKPLWLYVLLAEVSVQIEVPEVSLVRCYHL